MSEIKETAIEYLHLKQTMEAQPSFKIGVLTILDVYSYALIEDKKH